MFYVINKEKLTAYAVSVFTVIILFVMAGVITPKNNTVETSAETKNDVSINNQNVNDENNTNSNKIIINE
ncbi:MAG: hypothetical protein IKF83_03100 [Clostridia bacterium]|nr:hypothetical protein [Clostridia bacterium]